MRPGSSSSSSSVSSSSTADSSGGTSSGSSTSTGGAVSLFTLTSSEGEGALAILAALVAGSGASESIRYSTTQPHQRVDPWSPGDRPGWYKLVRSSFSTSITSRSTRTRVVLRRHTGESDSFAALRRASFLRRVALPRRRGGAQGWGRPQVWERGSQGGRADAEI